MKRIQFVVISLACLLSGRLSAGESPGAFPVPPELKPNVQFWVDVFTKYTKDQAVIHDMDNPQRIYAVVDFADFGPLSEKKKDQLVEDQRTGIIRILRKLGEKSRDASELSEGELNFSKLFGENPNLESFQKAADRVRSQSGLRESFVEGLIRSGRYLGEIRRIFSARGLPEELVYLPHVESSYNWRALSRAGAVGVWQFTQSTGKLFLAVNDAIDERRDPILSAVAAARLLKHNFEATGNWPLAVTAYNHGLLSIRRAMEKLNTDDLMHIIRFYEHKPFGFASKNFYAEFLAAVQVARNPSQYFGDLVSDPPFASHGEELPVPLTIEAVQRAFRCGRDTLTALNPAFLPPLFKGGKAIPRGYVLRLPSDADIASAYETLTSDGYLPRGACRAWCKGSEKVLFHLIESPERGRNAFGPRT